MPVQHPHALYDLLYERLPQHRSAMRGKRLNIQRLGNDLGVTYQTVNSWFSEKRDASCHRSYYMPVKWIVPLCQLPESTLTEDILRPYTVLGT